MTELVAWYNLEQTEKTIHPLIAIAMIIVVFLEIHPFKDGNGRLSSVLTTLLLLRAGYAYVPYSSLLIIDLAKKQGRITIKDVVLASDANRNTIKTHLRKLTQSGQIKQHGAGRGVWYGLA